jgi:hypothetical protein
MMSQNELNLEDMSRDQNVMGDEEVASRFNFDQIDYDKDDEDEEGGDEDDKE